jgi:hypothetical protein
MFGPARPSGLDGNGDQLRQPGKTGRKEKTMSLKSERKKERRLFVSTIETQGQRKNDFNFVPEGEIVAPFGFICTGQKADGPCGCARSLSGIVSRRGTTTAKVVKTKMTKREFADLLTSYIQGAGWTNFTSKDGLETASFLLKAAATFDAGTVVEFRDDIFAARSVEQTAQAA